MPSVAAVPATMRHLHLARQQGGNQTGGDSAHYLHFPFSCSSFLRVGFVLRLGHQLRHCLAAELLGKPLGSSRSSPFRMGMSQGGEEGPLHVDTGRPRVPLL